MPRSEEQDFASANLELVVTNTVTEAPFKWLKGHGEGCVMRAYLDALSDDREGESKRSGLDQRTADPSAPDVALVQAEVCDLPDEVERKVLSGERTGER